MAPATQKHLPAPGASQWRILWWFNGYLPLLVLMDANESTTLVGYSNINVAVLTRGKNRPLPGPYPAHLVAEGLRKTRVDI